MKGVRGLASKPGYGRGRGRSQRETTPDSLSDLSLIRQAPHGALVVHFVPQVPRRPSWDVKRFFSSVINMHYYSIVEGIRESKRPERRPMVVWSRLHVDLGRGQMLMYV